MTIPPRDYRPDIDGLRGVAVLLVVGRHIGLPGTSGGFTGVDVFFAISGYLITGLLIREWKERGRIDVGPVGDVGHCHLVETSLGEQVEC